MEAALVILALGILSAFGFICVLAGAIERIYSALLDHTTRLHRLEQDREAPRCDG